MIRRLRLIHKSQRGLTLVELLIAILLAGIVTAGITITIGHMFAWTTRTNNHMTAVRQVQSAGYWVSRDALQAQQWTISEAGSSNPVNSGFPFTLEWEWEGKTTEVTYSITGENRLMRTVKITGNDEISSYVAQYIDIALDDDGNPNTHVVDGNAISFRVTATVGGQSETRVYDVTPRPDSPSGAGA